MRRRHPARNEWLWVAISTLLVALPVSAGGVAVVGMELEDNGDGDGFADTQETVTLRLVVRNMTDADLQGLTARLSTTEGARVCLTRSVIDIGDLAAGEERRTDDGFVFVVLPSVERASVGEELSVRFAVSVGSSSPPSISPVSWLDLDLDLDVTGGSGPTTYFESFESGFGSFTTMHLDESLNPPESDLNNRPVGVLNATGHHCQYDEIVPSFGGSVGLQCFPNPNGASDAFYFDVVSERAFSGLQSMAFSVYLGAAAGYTTPTAQLEAIRTTDPIAIAWEPSCSVGHTACDDELDCPPGETCDPARPRLSFKHQVSFMDHRALPLAPGLTADRGVVAVQLAAGDGSPVGSWIKAYPFAHTYDSRPQTTFTNCSFDPADDGNTEADFFDPSDPLRSFGPSSTCAPEFTFAHQGDTDNPYAPLNVGNADGGPGLEGELGTGTWVEPVVDLSRFRGRRLRIRFLATGLKVGGALTWENVFAFNPDPADDGWFIDDVTITGALAVPAAAAVDAADNSGLPFDLGADSDADGVFDVCDNCPSDLNPTQLDQDHDGTGDACDPFPFDSLDDIDGDGIPPLEDNCPLHANPLQEDADGDLVGDACDTCPLVANPGQGADEDGDGVGCSADNCPLDANPDQGDEDRDGIGDRCDRCPGDAINDADGDGVCWSEDTCPGTANPQQGTGVVLAAATSDFVLSPDDAYLVFTGQDDRLYAVQATGGPRILLSAGVVTRFAITSDSATVVFRRDDLGLYRVSIQGGLIEPLSPEFGGPAVDDFLLSSDGTRVVYRMELDGSHEVFSVPTQGGPSVQLSVGTGETGNLRISPSGARVLYTVANPGASHDELYSVPAGGGPAVLLTPPLGESEGAIDGYAEFSPDGSRVVYRVGDSAIYSIPADGGAPAIKISGLFGGTPRISTFAISADGTKVVYKARTPTMNPSHLFQVPIAGGALPIQLTLFEHSGTGVDEYRISPDSGSVAFTAESQAYSRRELFVVPIGGGQGLITDVGGYIRSIRFTPDGTRVVFVDAGPLDEIYVVPTGGGHILALGDAPGEVVYANYLISEDGSNVLYGVGRPNRLYRASLDDGTWTEISEGMDMRPNGRLAWTADTSIAYWQGADGELFGTWVLPDADGDGIHAACDCDPTDPSIHPGAEEVNDGLDNNCPGDAGFGLVDELASVGFDAPDHLAWGPQQGALTYEIIRAEDPVFNVGCWCGSVTSDAATIPESPPPGGTYYYLARAASPYQGSAGVTSAGSERAGVCLAAGCGSEGPPGTFPRRRTSD